MILWHANQSGWLLHLQAETQRRCAPRNPPGLSKVTRGILRHGSRCRPARKASVSIVRAVFLFFVDLDLFQSSNPICATKVGAVGLGTEPMTQFLGRQKHTILGVCNRGRNIRFTLRFSLQDHSAWKGYRLPSRSSVDIFFSFL